MTFDDLIERYGNNNSRIAEALGTSPQLVRYWRHNGIPATRQAWIQAKTRGRLKAAPDATKPEPEPEGAAA